MSYLLPPDQVKTKLCPDCYGEKQIFHGYEVGNIECERCNGTGEIIIDDEPNINDDSDDE